MLQPLIAKHCGKWSSTPPCASTAAEILTQQHFSRFLICEENVRSEQFLIFNGPT